jgi:hypothetical protein
MKNLRILIVLFVIVAIVAIETKDTLNHVFDLQQKQNGKDVTPQM